MLQPSSPSKPMMNPEMVSFGTLAVNVNGVGTLYAPITALISPPEVETTSGSPSPFSFGSEVTSVAVTPMVSPTALVTWTEHVCADAGLDCSDITAHISNTKRPTRFMPTSCASQPERCHHSGRGKSTCVDTSGPVCDPDAEHRRAPSVLLAAV